MTLWIILTIVGSFTAGVILGELLRRSAGSNRGGSGAMGSDAALARGMPQEAVPGAGDPTHAGRPDASGGSAAEPHGASILSLARHRSATIAALGGVAALVLVGLYAAIERPEPTAPQPSGRSDGASAVERLAALAQQPEAAPTAAEGALASVDDMIERLAARLRQQSDDPEGWRMLGWSYFNTQRFGESAAAYLKAIELRPAFAEFRSLRGEALVSAANGLVTADAMRVFDEALALDPADPKARFFKGLAKAQAGDKQAALADWITILDGADPNAPWLAEIKQKVAELGREIGVDVSARGRPAAASGDILRALAGPPVSASPARPAPTAENVGAADALAPAEQTAMIRGMVEGLADRLEQSPHDVEGWIRLMRSRLVLGETDRAKQALDRALVIFSDAPQERSQIAAAARELGMTP